MYTSIPKCLLFHMSMCLCVYMFICLYVYMSITMELVGVLDESSMEKGLWDGFVLAIRGVRFWFRVY
jgi:hypothetical protein